MAQFEDSVNRLAQRARILQNDAGAYPVPCNMIDRDDNVILTRFRITSVRDTNPFHNARGAGIQLERDALHIATFPPDLIPKLGSRVVVVAPHPDTGTVYEIVEPVRPSQVGYSVGLAFVSGPR